MTLEEALSQLGARALASQWSLEPPHPEHFSAIIRAEVARLRAEVERLTEAIEEIDDAAWKGNSFAATQYFRLKISNLCRKALDTP